MRDHLQSEQDRMSPWAVVKSILGNRNALMGLLFTSVLMFGHFTIIPFIAPYMVGNVGFSEEELSYIYLVGGALTIFTSPRVGRAADKYGRLQIFTLFGLLVLIPIVLITHLPPIPLWQALVVSGLFFILANGRMVPSTTMVTSVIRPENRGSFMSIRSSVQQISSGLATLLAGFLISDMPSEINENATALVGYENVGYVAVVFSLIALVVARKLRVAQGA